MEKPVSKAPKVKVIVGLLVVSVVLQAMGVSFVAGLALCIGAGMLLAVASRGRA